MLYDFVDIVLNNDQWELAFMVEHQSLGRFYNRKLLYCPRPSFRCSPKLMIAESLREHCMEKSLVNFYHWITYRYICYIYKKVYIH